MLFSVITVCFNSQETIADTLASVSCQDFADFEHIVVDGASRDDTMAVVERHAHSRLRWSSEPDGGLYDAMNKGLRTARGNYVLFLNADDFLDRRDALSLVAAQIRNTGADCVFAATTFVRRDGKTPVNRIYSPKHFRAWWLRLGAMPPHPSMFVRRELLVRLGGFNTIYRIGADFDLIARALLKERSSWTVLPVIITKFRVGGLSTAGLQSTLTLTRECAHSLRALGQPLASLAVLLRIPLKLITQVRLRRDKPSPLASTG